jgi:putative Mg2+ transporter-C (MgtC) family protein
LGLGTLRKLLAVFRVLSQEIRLFHAFGHGEEERENNEYYLIVMGTFSNSVARITFIIRAGPEISGTLRQPWRRNLMDMPLSPSWSDLAIRLALTMVAGAIIGFNRGARGHAAGLRTTILVGLAASIAMIQANILLPLSGKTAESFGVMDLMRLPLGILTGVGFIGGGAILRRGDLLTGVTTAATLWMMTVIGLCLGGGQLILGSAATVLAVTTLWALKRIEMMIPREHHARIVIACEPSWSVLDEVARLLGPMKCEARFQKRTLAPDAQRADYAFELAWVRPYHQAAPSDLLAALERRFQIKSFEFTTES